MLSLVRVQTVPLWAEVANGVVPGAELSLAWLVIPFPRNEEPSLMGSVCVGG